MNPYLGAYLLGIAVGLLAGGLAVAALLSSLGRRIDQATTLPDPHTDVTGRIDPVNVIDLPRYERSTRSWTA